MEKISFLLFVNLFMLFIGCKPLETETTIQDEDTMKIGFVLESSSFTRQVTKADSTFPKLSEQWIKKRQDVKIISTTSGDSWQEAGLYNKKYNYFLLSPLGQDRY